MRVTSSSLGVCVGVIVIVAAAAVAVSAHAQNVLPGTAPPPPSSIKGPTARSVKTAALTAVGFARDHRTVPASADQPGSPGEALSLLVPVNVSKLDTSVTQLTVICNVDSQSNWLPSGQNRAGQGRTSFPITKVGSGYSGVIAVPIVPFPGKDPKTYKSYRCDLMGETNGQSYYLQQKIQLAAGAKLATVATL
jgi:hypothetical protein